MQNVAIETGSIGAVTADFGHLVNVSLIATDASGTGIGDISAGASIGFPGVIENSSFISNSSIGAVSAPGGISSSIFLAAGDIGNILAIAGPVANGIAIAASGFDAGGNIGNITSTGSITGSLFVAGLQLSSDFAADLSGAGTTAFGFGHGNVVRFPFQTASIGAVTLQTDVAGLVNAAISSTTFFAGVGFSGPEGQFGLGDDFVSGGSTIGAISAPNGLTTVFIESGSIGDITVSGGQITNTHVVADDSNANGIGAINASIGSPTSAVSEISNSTFISNSSIGDITSTAFDGIAIDSSHFRAASGIGKISATSFVVQ